MNINRTLPNHSPTVAMAPKSPKTEAGPQELPEDTFVIEPGSGSLSGPIELLRNMAVGTLGGGVAGTAAGLLIASQADFGFLGTIGLSLAGAATGGAAGYGLGYVLT